MPGESRSRSDYFDAGMELLASGGIGAVTISALCYRLGVTKGSFYHHFASGSAFQQGLLAYWELDRAAAMAEQVLAITDPIERFDALKHAAVGVHHEAESAIRAWARSDPAAAATQARVDAGRELGLLTSLIDGGVPKDRAPLLARIGMSILIAAQQLERPVDRTKLLAMLDEYQWWLESAIAQTNVVRAASKRRAKR